MNDLELKEINKIICRLDKIIRVKVYENGSYVKYSSPNVLQTQLGRTVSITTEHDDSSYMEYRDLDFLALVLDDLCKQKGFETDFLTQYKEIQDILSSEEFELSDAEKSDAKLMGDIDNLLLMLGRESDPNYEVKNFSEYPTYKKEKLAEALLLKKDQVKILLKTYYVLTRHMASNGLESGCRFVDSYEKNWYEDSNTIKYVVDDSYMEVLRSLLNCCKILVGREYMDAYGQMVIDAAKGIVKGRSK